MQRRYLADGDPAVAYGPDPEDEEDQDETGDASDAGSLPGANENGLQAYGSDFGASPIPTSSQAIPGAIGITSSGSPTFGVSTAPVAPSFATPEPQAPSGAPDYLKDLAAIKKAYGEMPVRQEPKWWERVAAGVLGGAAGYSNAARRAAPIDIQKATEPLLYPGYDSKLAVWQSRVVPLEEAAKISAQQVSAGYGAQKAQSEAQLKQAQALMNLKRADYYGNLGATRTVEVTPEMESASGGIFKHGDRIAASTATEIARIAAGKYEKPEKTIAVTDPDLARVIGVKPGSLVPFSIYQTGITANGQAGRRNPTTAELGVRAAGGSTGNPTIDALDPRVAKQALDAAKDRDPLTEIALQDRLKKLQDDELDKIGGTKNANERALNAQRAVELRALDSPNVNPAEKPARISEINRRYAGLLQNIQNEYANQARRRGVRGVLDYDVDPQTLQYKVRTPAAQAGTAQGLPAATGNGAQAPTQAPATANGGPVTVTLPGGRVKTFPNQAALDAFSKEAGITFGPAH